MWLNVVYTPRMCLCFVAYIFAAQVDLGHALGGRDQEPDDELLPCHVDVRGHLAAWGERGSNHTSSLHFHHSSSPIIPFS